MMKLYEIIMYYLSREYNKIFYIKFWPEPQKPYWYGIVHKFNKNKHRIDAIINKSISKHMTVSE